MVFNYLPQYLKKDTEQNDIFCAAVFCSGIVAGHYFPYPLCFIDCVHENQLITSTWQLIYTHIYYIFI